jgi:hypothetical protein
MEDSPFRVKNRETSAKFFGSLKKIEGDRIQVRKFGQEGHLTSPHVSKREY